MWGDAQERVNMLVRVHCINYAWVCVNRENTLEFLSWPLDGEFKRDFRAKHEVTEKT